MSKSNSTVDFKRIGLVDYRLDNFHADVFVKEIRAAETRRRYTISGAYALKSGPSVEWANRQGIRYCDELEELCESADCLMVLAPSNPECHLDLCRQVFPFGKTTYVDKTFAPDRQTAEEIFALADRYDVAVQTTSAMRYTAIQTAVAAQATSLRDLTVWGGGTSFAEYGIHGIELAVSCLGPAASQMVVMGSEQQPVIVLQYEQGRTATFHMNAVSHAPFRATIATELATEMVAVDNSALFANTTNAILDFFDAGTALIDRRESLLVRRILDVVSAGTAKQHVVSLKSEPIVSGVPAPKGLGRRTSPVTETKW